ncbi:TldD/PmbA family protein [Citrifermentans bremense]|uniref:TldD/PmbA family protein n=1 Tax=Citrifermentans bremense TaxID=60035 RepID=UPI000419ACE9|nr:TldD/PmbA family protein [Citrifermentans bremense]
MELAKHADAVERLLTGRNLDGYEIFVSQSRDLSIEARQGQVDAFRAAEPFGVAVRLKVGNGLGFSYSTSMEPAALAMMIYGALVAARMQTQDPGYTLAAPATSYPELPWLYDPELPVVDEELKVARVLELERLVLAADPRVKRVRKCSYGESVYSSFIRNSLGLEKGYRGSYVTCSASAVAEERDDAQSGWDFAFSPSFSGIDIEAVAKGAGSKATALLGARNIPGMRCPVVLDNHVAAGIVELLAPSFLGEAVHKGKSLFMGKEGEQVFSELVTLHDDGLLLDGMGTAPCDGEGVPQQDTPLVTGGVLQGFLYDSYWGKKAGKSSTGNAQRGGIKGAPRSGANNLMIDPGEASLETLLAGVERGVLITEVMGMHTANTISGDFSVGASGFYLERGEILYPVKGMALAGNLMHLFKGVDQVGSDLRFFGGAGSPSLRIAELEISGS